MSDETFRTIQVLAKKFGKISITANEATDFVVNCILVPIINGAIFVLQEAIVSAKDFGKRMGFEANHLIGPLTLADLIGLDTLLIVQENPYKELGESK